jgi:hypothetical protein
VVGAEVASEQLGIDRRTIVGWMTDGANGSNKDIRDFSFGRATATLYQIAQIADIGNQLLQQSGGAAETVARRRLGSSIGLAESNFVVNSTGSGQPLGILPALLAYGDIAAFKTTLSLEPRVATLGKAIGALEVGCSPSVFSRTRHRRRPLRAPSTSWWRSWSVTERRPSAD